MTKRVTYFCLCGARLKAYGMSCQGREKAMRIFLNNHKGPGCGPTTAAKAAAARRRLDRSE